jgi:hypothetical protein
MDNKENGRYDVTGRVNDAKKGNNKGERGRKE